MVAATPAVAQWLPGDQDKEKAMRRADQALYDAKRSGRDQCALYGALSHRPPHVPGL